MKMEEKIYSIEDVLRILKPVDERAAVAINATTIDEAPLDPKLVTEMYSAIRKAVTGIEQYAEQQKLNRLRAIAAAEEQQKLNRLRAIAAAEGIGWA